MKLRMTEVATAAVMLLAVSNPAIADGEGDERRLIISASQCAAVEGYWRDNGDISVCSVEIGHFVCEVDELECEFEPAGDRLYTYEQVWQFLDGASEEPSRTVADAS